MSVLFNPYQHLTADFDGSKIKIIDLPDDTTKCPVGRVAFRRLSAHLPPEENQAIASAWAKELAKEPLQDEPILSVRFLNTQTGNFVLAPDMYKTWKTTAKKGFYSQFGEGYIPNLMNVQMLIQTADNQIVLGTRPPKANGKVPAFQIPGGMVKVDDCRQTGCVKDKAVILPEVAAVREFTEEVGPVPVPLENVSYLGASFYAGRVITTFYYTARINMTAAELTDWRLHHREEIKDYKDFPQEYYVPATVAGIQAARETGRLRETAEVGLLLKGRELLGPAWFKRTCPQRIRE